MVKRKGTMTAVRESGEPPSKKRKKNVQETEEVPTDKLATKPESLNKTAKPGIFPKEHVGSRFCDSRVYIPTVYTDFTADAEQGSMLDEVSLLPLEDLTSLMCGNTVYSLIKKTKVGADLAKCCAELQEKHARLDLKAIANMDSIRRRSIRLLRHEGCSEEFLTPHAISAYVRTMLRSVIGNSSWNFDTDEFSRRLSLRLVLARPGSLLIDSTFYSYKFYQLDYLSEEDFADIREKGGLTQKQVKVLLQSLLANNLRFFVLYCVHGLRDQVVTKLAKTGEVMYQLKYPSDVKVALTVVESDDEVLEECIPLDDDYIPLLKELMMENRSVDRASLPFQIKHLPPSQIVRLILGEALYEPVSYSSPAFLVHLEEYATFLKETLSYFQLRNKSHYTERLRQKNTAILRSSEVKAYISKIFTTIEDWLLESKHLVTIIRNRTRQVKPDSDRQLWNSEDCDHKPYSIYHPLRRFTNYSKLLSKDLAMKISRRFNHFFLVYAFHLLRETFQVCEHDGSLRFFSKQPEEQPEQSGKQKSDVIDSSEKPAVEPDFLPPAADMSIIAPGGDDWESKLYERVKMDPNVPPYFKTTFGILVANNRDLRDEKAFLHNRLNRS
ncbi:hypothetical protein V3C99_003998 [Haemonchus contortus]